MLFAGKDWKIDCENPIDYDSSVTDESKNAYFSLHPVTTAKLCVRVRAALYKVVK